MKCKFQQGSCKQAWGWVEVDKFLKIVERLLVIF